MSINKFYNFVIVWIVSVTIVFFVFLFRIPAIQINIKSFIWSVLFTVSFAICFYFDVKYSTHLKLYIKKNHPALYDKYYFYKKFKSEKWTVSVFTKFSNDISNAEEKLIELISSFRFVRIFFIFQTIYLMVAMSLI